MTEAVAIAAQLGVAAVFALAAVSKLHDPVSFRAALGASAITRPLQGALTIAVPAIELLVAGAVVTAPAGSAAAAMLAAAALLALMAGWLASILFSGVETSCACFGPGEHRVGPATLARTALLAACAFAGALLVGGSGTPVSDVEVLPRAVLFSVAVLTLSAAVGLHRAWPELLLHRSDIRPEGKA